MGCYRGVASIGGAGGVSGTGTGNAQTTTVYGKFRKVLPCKETGSYSDSVVVTVTY